MAVSKKTGKKSLAANDFLIPLPPGPPTASDVGTNRPYDNGSAVVEFSAVSLAVSYKVYAAATGQSPVTATGTSSPIIVSGLKSNTLYTFTVTGFNDQGVEGDPSDPSVATLITTVPATPSAPTASSPNPNQDVISWIEPLSGGKTITGYIWTASDGKTNLAGGNPGGGPTTSTSRTINQEAGTAQTYTVYAINANGNSLTSPASNSITTTFSFAPFGAFGFSPFAAFGFSPFSAFGFSPRCITAETKLATINDNMQVKWVKAKDITIGTKVFSPTWDEFKNEEIESPYESKVYYDSLTNLRLETGEIIAIAERIADKTVIINDNIDKKFSSTQPLLVIKQNEDRHSWVFAKDVEMGDMLWEYSFEDKTFTNTAVTKTDLALVEETVYAFDVKDFDTFIAGSIVCHNIRKV